ncbi:MAG: hypothetical protein U5M23_00290 [Marinagarivorans sp.]|nr:hypothetical protein [Marinagarivorans sp.]
MISKTKEKEIKAIDQLSKLAGVEFRTDAASRALPYQLAPENYQADGVWIAPKGCDRTGIVLEIQGGRYIAGKHGNAKGLSTDDRKLIWAQLAGFAVVTCDYSNLEDIGKALNLLVAQIYAGSGTDADNPMEI